MDQTAIHPGPFAVGVTLLAVPDGFRSTGRKRLCRLSLALAPKVDPASGTLQVDIRYWPTHIARLTRSLRIATGQIAGTVDARTIVGARYLDETVSADTPLGFDSEATTLWRRIFDDGSVSQDAGFKALLDALKAGGVGPYQKSDNSVRKQFGTYQALDLANTIDTLYGSVLATSLLQRLASLAFEQTANGEPVHVDSHQVFRDAGSPGVPWWQMLHREWVGLTPLGDPVSLLAAGASSPERGDGPGHAIRLVSQEMADAARLFGGEPTAMTAQEISAQSTERVVKVFNSLDQAQTYFAGKIGDLDFWENANGTADQRSARDPAKMFKNEIARFAENWGLGYTSPEPPKPDSGEEAREAAGRKYAAILSYPTLAKYLGLVVDIEVDASLLLGANAGDRVYGAVAVDIPAAPKQVGVSWPPPDPEQLDWSAYVFARGRRDYFGPCDREESVNKFAGANQAFSDGIVDLNVTVGPTGPRRFELQTLDITNAVLGLKQHSAQITEADRQGRLRSEQSTKLPELRTRGIALIDRDQERETIEQARRERQNLTTADASPGSGKFRITDASDLVLGYRIDAVLATKGGEWKDEKRWRTLVGRTITYGSRDVNPKFLSSDSIVRVRERDDGHVRPMTGEQELNDGHQTKMQITPNPEVFIWPGESLGVPSLRETSGPGDPDCRSVWPDPCRDLAVDLEIDLPSAPKKNETDRRPLPLRELRSYLFGARLCFMNGCGLSFDEAVPRYLAADKSLVIGQGAQDPLTYQRRNEIQAPDVLLPWDDRVVVAAPEDRVGENIDYLVVRSGKVNTKNARRFVIPARTTFDLTEQHGTLDSDKTSMQPAGAFVGAIRAQLDPVLGTFPVARGRSWEPKPQSRKVQEEGANTAKEVSRGAVLVLDASATPPGNEFYPDPLGNRMRARFTRNGRMVQGFDTLKDAIEFWSKKESPADARPVVLELRSGRKGERKGLRGWFDTKDYTAYVRPEHATRSVALNKLSIVLEPAETVELEIWSDPDPGHLLAANHSVARALKLLASIKESSLVTHKLELPEAATIHFNEMLNTVLSGQQGAKELVLGRVLSQSAMGQVSTRRVLRLVHAVDQPIPPKFVRKPQPDGQLYFQPVVLTVGGGDQQRTLADSWTTYVSSQEAAQKDQLKWPSEKSGSTTFFVGEISIDRPSTGRVRCEAGWADYGTESVRLDAKSQKWLLDPQFNHAQLFTINELRTDDPVRELSVDLLRDDDEVTLRALSYAFPNGKARHLALRLISTSRFTDYYPSETKSEKETRETTGVGKYESSTETLLTSTAKVWVPCTFRPPQPQIDRNVPVFRWTIDVHDEGREIRWKRESSVRIYLASWHSTGEGEVLGIACWPDDLVNADAAKEAAAAAVGVRKDICELDDKTGRYSTHITRWGTDPIHLSGQLDDLISADRFSGFQDKVSNLLLTLDAREAEDTQSSDPPPAPLPVSVLTYAPQLDPTEGIWYCDVTVDHGAAYFPFLQLGVVRYQPHSVEGLELSTSTACWAQIPPRREGRVKFLNDRQFVMELEGIGFHRSETGSAHDEQRPLSDFPVLNIRLMRAVRWNKIPNRKDGTVNWQPVVDQSGNLVEELHLRPTQQGAAVLWSWLGTLPHGRRDVHYALLIEEVEMMAMDELIENPNAKTCDDLVFRTEPDLRERGPLFSHIVDLGV